MRGGEPKDEDDERNPLEICVFFEDDEKRQVPIHLVMADALPGYAPGELVTLQVAAFTEDVHFYPDMETFDNMRGDCPKTHPPEVVRKYRTTKKLLIEIFRHIV